jgi:hypothetical protein
MCTKLLGHCGPHEGKEGDGNIIQWGGPARDAKDEIIRARREWKTFEVSELSKPGEPPAIDRLLNQLEREGWTIFALSPAVGVVAYRDIE